MKTPVCVFSSQAVLHLSVHLRSPPFFSLLSTNENLILFSSACSDALSTREGGRTAKVPDRGTYSSVFHVEIEYDLSISFFKMLYLAFLCLV